MFLIPLEGLGEKKVIRLSILEAANIVEKSFILSDHLTNTRLIIA